MEGISDIRITGVDEQRPPVIRKEPYIDIFFKLSHKAPVDWCNEFNAILSKHPNKPKIKEQEGLFIDAWVRSPDEIIALLKDLKLAVSECSQKYIERLERLRQSEYDANMLATKSGGEQERLNKIIAALDFEVSD